MLNRLMLRLGIVNALTPQPGEPSPTIAGEAVFDSRLDDLEFDDQKVEVPVCIVYTEDDESTLLDRGAGGSHGASLRHVNVRIEIAIGSFETSVTDGRTQVTYSLPTTDAEMEALLDMFEAQVYRTLDHPIRPASVALQHLVIQRDAWHSTASRSNEGNNRLAARTLTMRLRIKPECMPSWQSTPLPVETAIPRFTNAPYLDPLIKVLAADPRNAGLMAMLREAAGGGPQIYVPPFQRLGVQLHLRQPTDPTVCAILSRHLQSDHPVDYQTSWTVQQAPGCPVPPTQQPGGV